MAVLSKFSNERSIDIYKYIYIPSTVVHRAVTQRILMRLKCQSFQALQIYPALNSYKSTQINISSLTSHVPVYAPTILIQSLYNPTTASLLENRAEQHIAQKVPTQSFFFFMKTLLGIKNRRKAILFKNVVQFI
ncbi:unnamed protein product [Ixodes pacificus]